ncbi:MAG TPA: DUF2510 domain-containing protein [Acidimicrobiales bacterium]|nr:DUF2510 domain-containing protein [Acidimicrobiales bacterium]
MGGPRLRAPGWYPEPDIHPGSHQVLRYWNGRHWTDRRRPMPILASLDLNTVAGAPVRALEGPARMVDLPIIPLPAIASELTVTREGPGGRTDTRDRSAASEFRDVDFATATGGSGRPPAPPRRDGGGGDDGSGDESQAPTRRLRKWWLFALVAVLAAVAVVLAGEAMRPPSPGPRVLTDATFVRLANDACAKTLPTLRPADGGQMPAAITPAQAADAADKAASGLDALATRLGNLPAVPADRPHIVAWLDGWHRYAAIGHQYAGDLRTHGGTNAHPPAFMATASTLAKNTDSFSRANGLTACLFAYNYTPDPSSF